MNPYFFGIATSLLVYRALSRKSLTPAGVLAAVATACVHALHTSNLPFLLLITFYLLGTTATKTKHDVKSRLTVSSSGAAGGEGARTAVQVLANSVVASALVALEYFWDGTSPGKILIGIIANYAATTADTLSSELGILSKTAPRLITAPWRACPPGTNGGVSATGLAAGAAGAFIIAAVSLPFISPPSNLLFLAFVTAIGTFGSLLDSFLGATLQESVIDIRTGKVVEAPGGGKVLVVPGERKISDAARVRSQLGNAPQSADEAIESSKEAEQKKDRSRKVISGWGVLSNNGVNLAMAVGASAVGVVLGSDVGVL